MDQNLPNIQLGLNGTVNSAIGVTPSEALMGYRVYSQIMLEGEGREVVDVTRVRDRMVAATESYQADQKRRSIDTEAKLASTRKRPSTNKGDLQPCNRYQPEAVRQMAGSFQSNRRPGP
jgi:hypothetical protein